MPVNEPDFLPRMSTQERLRAIIAKGDIRGDAEDGGIYVGDGATPGGLVLSGGAASIPDNGVTTAKIVDGNVTDQKLATAYAKADGTRAFTGDQSMGGHKLTNLAAPTAGGDAVTKTYADALVIAVGGVVYKGVIDCAANPNYPAGAVGDLYRISVAGKIGGGSGVVVAIGDIVICLVAGIAGTQASVGANWNVIPANLTGAILGPVSSVVGNLPMFNNTAGSAVADSGLSVDTSVLLGTSNVKLPPQNAVKSYVDTITHTVTGLDPTGVADAFTVAQAFVNALPATTNNGSVQAQNAQVVSVPPGIYALSDTLKLSRGCVYDLRGVYFTPHASFSGNKPLVEVGNTSASMRVYRGRILGGVHVYQSLDWTTSRIGIRLANTQEWDIDGLSADGFPIGIELYSDTQGNQYHNLKIEKVTNCFVGLKNSLSNSGWTNEFTIQGGHFNYGSGDPSTGAPTTPNSRPIHVWCRGSDKWLFENTAFETRNPREVAWGATTDCFVIEQGGFTNAASGIFFLNCRYEVAPFSGSVITADYMAGTFSSGTARCMLLGCSTGHITVTDNSAATGIGANIDAKHPGSWIGSLTITPFAAAKTPLTIAAATSQSAALLTITGGNSTPLSVNGNARLVAGSAALPSGISVIGGTSSLLLQAAADVTPITIPFNNNAGTLISSLTANQGAAQENLTITNKSSQANSGIRFQTGATPSERARLDVNGNLGLGIIAPTSTLHVTGSIAFAPTALAANTTLDGTQSTLLVSTNMTLTLPTAVTCVGRIYRIKKTDTGTTVTIATTSAQTIDGGAASAQNLTTQWSLLVVQSDGANWVKIN